MATITKSIKASAGDYTTPVLWEADLDNAAVYSDGDSAVGQLYDEAYSANIYQYLVINGGGDIGGVGDALASITI